MTQKEYRNAREIAETAEELYTFEHASGWWTSRSMTADDMREMRRDYKAEKANSGAEALEGSNGRAQIIPTESGAVLKSYYTEVCAIIGGEFVKTWEGFSVTTMKHINLFRIRYELPKLSKREWIEMEAGAAR